MRHAIRSNRARDEEVMVGFAPESKVAATLSNILRHPDRYAVRDGTNFPLRPQMTRVEASNGPAEPQHEILGVLTKVHDALRGIPIEELTYLLATILGSQKAFARSDREARRAHLKVT